MAKKRKSKSGRSEEHEGTVAKVTEITSASRVSFDDAITTGIARASRTLDQVAGAWIQEMKVDVRNGRIEAYRVNMKVTFVLND